MTPVLMTPTVAHVVDSLPPEGAAFRLGAARQRNMAPTLATAWAALPPGGVRPCLGRPGAAAPVPTVAHVVDSLPRARRRMGGFTLIELLVALSVMAVLAVLSWRGLDGMARAQTQTQARADDVLALQAALGQWTADLDAVQQVPQQPAVDWDGRVLRLTRHPSAAGGDGLLVVAWTRRAADGAGQWLRWQSPPLRNRGELQEAWTQAGLWAQNPSDDAKKREVTITPLEEWQIFYFRSDAWTNPLSSDGSAQLPAGLAVQAVPGTTTPEGIRVVLVLPPGQTLSGRVVRDWVRPTVGGGKS
jgi:general secretion pathway protein J